MVGLYRHSKTGNMYRALFTGVWRNTVVPYPDQSLGVFVFWEDHAGEPTAPNVEVWPWPHPHYEPCLPLLCAFWSGNADRVPIPFHTEVVVYVSCSGGLGRISVRTTAEFNEVVTIDGKNVPRFVREEELAALASVQKELTDLRAEHRRQIADMELAAYQDWNYGRGQASTMPVADGGWTCGEHGWCDVDMSRRCVKCGSLAVWIANERDDSIEPVIKKRHES